MTLLEWSYICAQSYPTLCNPMDCSPPGYSVHAIFQARILEWVAISYSRGSSRPGDWTSPVSSELLVDSLPAKSSGKPGWSYTGFNVPYAFFGALPLQSWRCSSCWLTYSEKLKKILCWRLTTYNYTHILLSSWTCRQSTLLSKFSFSSFLSAEKNQMD